MNSTIDQWLLKILVIVISFLCGIMAKISLQLDIVTGIKENLTFIKLRFKLSVHSMNEIFSYFRRISPFCFCCRSLFVFYSLPISFYDCHRDKVIILLAQVPSTHDVEKEKWANDNNKHHVTMHKTWRLLKQCNKSLQSIIHNKSIGVINFEKYQCEMADGWLFRLSERIGLN